MTLTPKLRRRAAWSKAAPCPQSTSPPPPVGARYKPAGRAGGQAVVGSRVCTGPRRPNSFRPIALARLHDATGGSASRAVPARWCGRRRRRKAGGCCRAYAAPRQDQADTGREKKAAVNVAQEPPNDKRREIHRLVTYPAPPATYVVGGTKFPCQAFVAKGRAKSGHGWARCHLVHASLPTRMAP
jgi:hypothetical protein